MSDRVTVSVIKADVGSVGGHARPHPLMMRKCEERLADGLSAGIINDYYVTRVGDDINLILTHNRGENNKDVHGLAWESFMEATKVAKSMKLYAAGQDLLTDAFSGNVGARGGQMGSGAARTHGLLHGRQTGILLFPAFVQDVHEPVHNTSGHRPSRP